MNFITMCYQASPGEMDLHLLKAPSDSPLDNFETEVGMIRFWPLRLRYIGVFRSQNWLFLIACLLNCFSLQGYLHFFENAEDRKLFIQHHLELPVQDEITIRLGTSIQSLWWWFCKLILQSCKWMYRFQDKANSYSLSWFFFFYFTSLFFS